MAKKDRKKGKTQQESGANNKEVNASPEKKTSLVEKIQAKAEAQTQAQPPMPRPLPRKKTPAEKRQARIDGIKKTMYASLLGVLAGFVCFFTLGMGTTTTIPWHFVLIVLVLVTYYIQKFTYSFMGIDAAKFGGKDWFYVEFLVIDLWLVTWTLLLN
ncbi:MAG TPA: hypothetical protein VN455_05215 [Methanotrichaceae archaeon]|nr:hypothetical protein [Methanotrichaceae archaeon]